MGASNQLHQEFREQEVDTFIPEVSMTREEEIISSLENRTMVLSYSSIKNLDSPVDFMDYKTKDWKPKTESQMLGTACDLLLLTPNEFDDKLPVIDKEPTTDKQVDFCNTLIKLIEDSKEEIIIDNDFEYSDVFNEAFKTNYSRGSASSVAHLIDYCVAMLSGKETISKTLKEKAEKICNNLKNQPDFMEALNKTTERQKRIDFEFMGWKFKSFLDTYSPGLFQDLKFATDCNPDKFQYDMRKFKYDVQFGVYSLGLEALDGETPEFEFLVYDAKGNYSILPVDYSYIKYAQKKVEYLVLCLEKMIAEKAYFRSYNFFNPTLRITKPNWIKGFDFEQFLEE